MNPQSHPRADRDLYAQLCAAQDRIAELEQELGARRLAEEPSSSSRLRTAAD